MALCFCSTTVALRRLSWRMGIPNFSLTHNDVKVKYRLNQHYPSDWSQEGALARLLCLQPRDVSALVTSHTDGTENTSFNKWQWRTLPLLAFAVEIESHFSPKHKCDTGVYISPWPVWIQQGSSFCLCCSCSPTPLWLNSPDHFSEKKNFQLEMVQPVWPPVNSVWYTFWGLT